MVTYVPTMQSCMHFFVWHANALLSIHPSVNDPSISATTTHVNMIDDTDDVVRCHDKEASRWTKNLQQLNLKASPQYNNIHATEYTMHARFSSFVKQWVRREESSAKWRTRQKIEIQRCCWMEMEPRACMLHADRCSSETETETETETGRSTFQLSC